MATRYPQLGSSGGSGAGASLIKAFGGLVVLGILAMFILPGTCSVVPPGHRGVSVTLGKVSEKLLPEGLTFKKPFVEHVEKVNVQQSTVSAVASCFSADLQTVTVSYSVLFRIPETEVINLFQNYRGDVWESLIQPRVEEALKQITSNYKAEELVKQREVIRMSLLDSVRKTVGTLAILADIPITNIDLTDELERAIEQKQVMEQTAKAKIYELEREQKEAEITLVKAKAEAEAVKIKGDALAASPLVIDLELVKKWDGRAPASVVTTGGGANVILPLSRQAPAAVAAPGQ